VRDKLQTSHLCAISFWSGFGSIEAVVSVAWVLLTMLLSDKAVLLSLKENEFD